MGTAPAKPEQQQLGTLQFIAIGQIDIGDNFRKTIDKDSLQELADSIKQRGILVPLLVRKSEKNGKYDLIAGQRRLLAAGEIELKSIPCIVTGFDAPTAAEVQIVENLQRVDLHPLEEAAAYQKLTSKEERSVENLALYVGKSVSYIRMRLQLVNLIEPIQKMFRDGKLNFSAAFVLARQTQEIQKDLLKNYLRGDQEIIASSLRHAIERNFMLDLATAPFNTKDAALYPEAGACTTCPKRTGFSQDLFPDIKKKDTCTDPVCFHEKERRFIKIQVGTHKDAVLLTMAAPYQSEKAKGKTDWVKSGNRSCPDTKQGLVIESIGYTPEEQAAKVGQLLEVCVNPKCKTHHPKPDYNPQTGGSRIADKKRKIELRRRGLVFQAIAEKRFATTTTDARAILDWAIRGLGSDHARALCQAMEWEIQKGKYTGKDYHATIAKNLAKLDTDGVEQWLYLVMLADTDLWFYNNVGTPSCKNLEGKAKLVKVPLDQIAKEAKVKPAKVAVAKAKK